MIHLITVSGDSAKDFYLRQKLIPDFKSLIRTITSKRVIIVSTWFRSDLFYCTDEPKDESILKLWALYTNADLSKINSEDFSSSRGDSESLTDYFVSINKLSANQLYYRLYQKAFDVTLSNDQRNPVARKILECDQFITQKPNVIRSPLINSSCAINSIPSKDTFSLAMGIINDEVHCN